jgi:hypothetical protein
VRLLDACCLDVLQDHLDEIPFVAVLRIRVVDQLVILVNSQHTVRREALDRERPGHADLALILVRHVIEVFRISLGSNRCVNFRLAQNTLPPPLGVQLSCLFRPCVISLVWDVPLFPF